MRNADVYQHAPATFKLLNNGVAKVSDDRSAGELETLHYELRTFVCEGQYEAGLHRTIDSYLTNLGRPEQPAAWVSGFFGSGKSHLVKMLRHLWVDTTFEGGATARGLADAALSERVREHLRELTVRGKQHGGLHAAAGTLGSGASGSVRLAILGIVFASKGLPVSYPRARLVMRLRREGLLDKVRDALTAAGRSLDEEVKNFRVSKALAQSLYEAGAGWGADADQTQAAFRAEYVERTDVDSEEFVGALRDALTLDRDDARLPCTIIVLDEVQQYIGGDPDRSITVQTAIEDACKGLGSAVTFVGTGQNALAGMPLLERLKGRFPIKVQLSDADVETVTRRTVLAKKNQALPHVQGVLDGARGELDRHLAGSRVGPRPEDRAEEVADYPILPTRRRLWEHVLRSTDASGTESQLRNQLKVVDEAVKATAEAPLGTVVGGDFIYNREALLQSAELPAEIDARIERLRTAATSPGGDPLDYRLCILAWLIGRLAREGAADLGVRATTATLADLLVTDLTVPSAALRARVEARLAHLEQSGDLMRVEQEYRIQTRASADWEHEFRRRRDDLTGDPIALGADRDTLLRTRVLDALKPVQRFTQGQSKTPRELVVGVGGPEAPKGDGIPVWVRTGWEVALDVVRTDARAAGQDQAVIFVYLPKRDTDALDRALATYKAAESTLQIKGLPAEAEGREARKAMETRRDAAAGERDRIVADVLAGAQVILAGGGDQAGTGLADAVGKAAQAALTRRYARFDEGDHKDWARVFDAARTGATAALEKVGHTDEPQKHPVVDAILRFIGAGKAGADVQAHFEAAPYGWPRDAVHGALAVLVMRGMARATKDGAAVEAKALEPRGIGAVRFQAEDVVLTVPERIALAGLFKNAGLVNVGPNDVTAQAPAFLAAVRTMASTAGGDAPLPALPRPAVLDEASSTSGNAQLRILYEARNELNRLMSEWSSVANLKPARLDAWRRINRALAHAHGLPGATEAQAECDAVLQQRSLLADSNPLSGVAARIETALREALSAARAHYVATLDDARAALAGTDAWAALDEPARADLLRRHDLATIPETATSSFDKILESLDRTPLRSWKDKADALPARAQAALSEAARLLEPDVRAVTLRRATIRSEAEIDAWLAEARVRLLDELARGPILI